MAALRCRNPFRQESHCEEVYPIGIRVLGRWHGWVIFSSRDFASDGHRRGFPDANHWTYVSRVKWEELLSWRLAGDCVIRFITLSSRNPFAFRDPQSSDHGEFLDSDDDFCTKMNFGRLPALPIVTLRKACCDRYAMTLGAATKAHTPFRTEQFPVCSEFLPAFEFES